MVTGLSPGDRTDSFVEDLEEVALRRSRTPTELPQHGSPAGSIVHDRARAQVMQAAPTATSALRHRGSSTTRRRASIDVPVVPLMMVIDLVHAQPATGARIGSGCCVQTGTQRLTKLQLCTLGEMNMCTLRLELDLCARLLCSCEEAACSQHPLVGVSASARGAKSLNHQKARHELSDKYII